MQGVPVQTGIVVDPFAGTVESKVGAMESAPDDDPGDVPVDVPGAVPVDVTVELPLPVRQIIQSYHPVFLCNL